MPVDPVLKSARVRAGALAIAALVALAAPGTTRAVDRAALTDQERICRSHQSRCIQQCIMTSRSRDAQQSCDAQCTAAFDACLQRPDLMPAGSSAGPALNEEQVAALAQRINDASRRQSQQVARDFMQVPEACGSGVPGAMMTNPMACLQARGQGYRNAADSERDTIISALQEAEASLDADLAQLPDGQVKRYKAMEALNAKYRRIVYITRGFAEPSSRGRDIEIQVLAQRFERKRLAASGGQDAQQADRGPRRALKY